LSYFVILVYIGFGIFFLTTTRTITLAFFGEMNPVSKITLGTVLVLYGLLRVYREIKKYRANHESE
jgi:hypothetical protein